MRELISNAADATDKLRFLALSNEDLYEGQSDEGIEIDGSEEQGTITIRDYGIGMTGRDNGEFGNNCSLWNERVFPRVD